ncbi:unnamed protein product [Acanthoscelides obtectus]|nr:unnamed protein product [Acanthoscelides obtectus]CAK1623802.1 hypothetical protein AOBTE_LOCUS2194 [Acanthoscelides obtectus]
MDFLDDVTTSRKTVCTPTTKQYVKKSTNKECDNTITPITQGTSRSTNPPRNKKVRRQETDSERGFEDAVSSLSAICKEESTEFDKFGERIAAQLKQFPLEDAVTLQLEIQQLITQTRLRVINRHKTSPVSINTCNPGLTACMTSPFSPDDYNIPTPSSVNSYHSESYSECSNINKRTNDSNTIFLAISGAQIIDQSSEDTDI